jgi:hypothetical protein
MVAEVERGRSAVLGGADGVEVRSPQYSKFFTVSTSFCTYTYIRQHHEVWQWRLLRILDIVALTFHAMESVRPSLPASDSHTRLHEGITRCNILRRQHRWVWH